MVVALWFTYAFWSLITTINAARRPRDPMTRFPAMWLPAMLVGEYAGPLLVIRSAASAGLAAAGAVRGDLGRAGLATMLVAQAILAGLWLSSRREAARIVREGAAPALPSSWRERLTRRASTVPNDVELACGVFEGQSTHIDAYLPAVRLADPAPALVHLHSGGWTGGDPHTQSRPMYHHFARCGWHVYTVRYPVAPAATVFDQVDAVERAISWVAAREDVDASRVVLSGASAGGHLASLAALRISASGGALPAACVTLYGIYDFLNRNSTRHFWEVIPRHLIRASADAAPDRYAAASPLDNVHAGAPPFFVIHGTYDSLVPPPEADHFVEALGRASGSEVRYLRVRGAQHAFDVISSPRTRAVVGAIARFVHSG